MKNQKTAKTAAAVKSVAAVVPTPVVAASNPNDGAKLMNLTLKKTKTNKGGEVYFSFGAGSVRFSKSAFATGQTFADLPESITLEVPEGVFAPAGAVRVGGGGGAKMTAEKLAKAQALAAKQTARAQKAQEKAAKALAAAVKAGIATTEATPEPAAV